MVTVSMNSVLSKEVKKSLGHLIYVVRDETLVFYVGQSRRDVITRFWEHMHTPSHLGQLIELNKPDSLGWAVDFYELADCAKFVQQKTLFALQAWQHFDMDMAEQALIQEMHPVLNRDFNPQPTQLPISYKGHAELGLAQLKSAVSPQERIWLNKMSLQGWVYEAVGENGRIQWKHSSGKTLTEADMLLYRQSGTIPKI